MGSLWLGSFRWSELSATNDDFLMSITKDSWHGSRKLGAVFTVSHTHTPRDTLKPLKARPLFCIRTMETISETSDHLFLPNVCVFGGISFSNRQSSISFNSISVSHCNRGFLCSHFLSLSFFLYLSLWMSHTHTQTECGPVFFALSKYIGLKPFLI